MDLRLNFGSYPYETKMYPTIKGITQGAPRSGDETAWLPKMLSEPCVGIVSGP